MSDKPGEKNERFHPFWQRWSQRKQRILSVANPPEPTHPDLHEPAPMREQDLPPIESLREDSEVSMFLNENISEHLRQQALRKLFHFGKFNICDGLDDYAEDYSMFEPLQDVLAMQQNLQRLGTESDQTGYDSDAPAQQFEQDQPEPDTTAVCETQARADDDEEKSDTPPGIPGADLT
jgi:hypothetical protein